MARFLGASGRHCGRIEEQDHRTVLQHRRQPAQGALLIGAIRNQDSTTLRPSSGPTLTSDAQRGHPKRERLVSYRRRVKPVPTPGRTDPSTEGSVHGLRHGTGVPNLTREDARATARRCFVFESYDIALDLTDGGGKPSDRTFRSTTTVRFAAARPGESTFIDVIAEKFHSVTAQRDSPVDVSELRPRRRHHSHRPGRRQRVGRRRGPALHEHRRGAASVRRPARRRDLPLLAVRDRGRQAYVRLLRPT